MSNSYARLRAAFGDDTAGARRCAERLLAMRRTLAPLRGRKNDASMLLATWNIRDFDSNKFKFGPRMPESFYYIAEIISCFDLVAVQEVNRDLSALEAVMRILGREWDYIATDTSEVDGGNDERMAFLFNREKVWFRKVAGEIVLPDGQLVVPLEKDAAPNAQPRIMGRNQFVRSPFLVAFQSGWFRFSLCTVHIYFGDDSGAKLTKRVKEIEQIVAFFANRQDTVSKQEKDRHGVVENYILLGDFNVVSPKHKTMRALVSNGFTVPAELDGPEIAAKRTNFYDQIAVRVKDPRFKVLGAGIVDMFEDVFRDTEEDRALYAASVPKKDPGPDDKYAAKTPAALYRKWRTWQMSDHAPLWIELSTDFADSYLGAIAKR